VLKIDRPVRVESVNDTLNSEQKQFDDTGLEGGKTSGGLLCGN